MFELKLRTDIASIKPEALGNVGDVLGRVVISLIRRSLSSAR